MLPVNKTKYLVVHNKFRYYIRPYACVCGPQASHNRNTVICVHKTKYLVVLKTFSDSIAPSACVFGPQASHNRNLVLPVDKINFGVAQNHK